MGIKEELAKDERKLKEMSAYELMERAKKLSEKIKEVCSEAELPAAILVGVLEDVIAHVHMAALIQTIQLHREEMTEKWWV